MNLIEILLIASVCYNTENKKETEEQQIDLCKDILQFSRDANDSFPILVTAMMMDYIQLNDIQLKESQTKSLFNIYDQLCNIFLSVIPRNQNCEMEMLFWKTIDKLYFDDDSVKGHKLRANFELRYKQEKELSNLRVCHFFSTVFSAEISEPTKYKICKYIEEKMNSVYIIMIIFSERSSCQSVTEIVKTGLHIKKINSSLEDKRLCASYTKEITITSVNEYNKRYQIGMEKDKIIKIEPNLNVKFVTNAGQIISAYKRANFYLDCQMVYFLIHKAAKDAIFAGFIHCEKGYKRFMSKNYNTAQSDITIKFSEIDYNKDMIKLARLLRTLPEIEDSNVVELLSFVSDIMNLFKFFHFYSIHDFFFHESNRYYDFLLSVTKLELKSFRVLIDIAMNRINFNGYFSDVLSSFESLLIQIIKASDRSENAISHANMKNTKIINGIYINMDMQQYITVINTSTSRIF